jgi:hypothetical protein
MYRARASSPRLLVLVLAAAAHRRLAPTAFIFICICICICIFICIVVVIVVFIVSPPGTALVISTAIDAVVDVEANACDATTDRIIATARWRAPFAPSTARRRTGTSHATNVNTHTHDKKRSNPQTLILYTTCAYTLPRM